MPKVDQAPLGRDHAAEFHGLAGWPAQPKLVPTVIVWSHGGSSVTVEGSFDSWSTRHVMQRSGKDFTIVKLLPPGVYQYKFIVDGDWKYAPDQPAMYDEDNNVNNVLEVQEYVPENLASLSSFDPPPSPPESYNMPLPTPEDYAKEPPAMPPHLQLTLLNVPPALDATASLPRPQHVILNHLYCQRNARGISATVVGATHRYKSKYVTTVDNLQGLTSLRSLQLDNNALTRLENLDHLAGSLVCLDLSFNAIGDVAGLEKLTRLQDLSLFCNRVSAVEGFTGLSQLEMLSLGRNCLENPAAVAALRPLKRLRTLTLAGNLAAAGPGARGWAIAHLPGLVFLDHAHVSPADVAAAREQFQARFHGVETIVEDVLHVDPEWHRLATLPGIQEGWAELKVKAAVAISECQAAVVEAYARRRADLQEHEGAAAEAVDVAAGAARAAVARAEQLQKAAERAVQAGADAAGELSAECAEAAEAAVAAAQGACETLQRELLDGELATHVALGSLLGQAERRHADAAEAGRQQFVTFFGTVRELEARFWEAAANAALAAQERWAADAGYNSAGAAIEAGAAGGEDPTAALLRDREALSAALTAAAEAHAAHIDALEDRLATAAVRNAAALMAERQASLERGHRQRLAEAVALVGRMAAMLDVLLTPRSTGAPAA
ncbi:hypothetical protein WJX81_002381 [Elliptochloris bilobata]|uniref:Association with the SNF1 complex (ASC) domain-containing protein n=1 Tax=Elliptochloris bilobata TaxID=381761 RepID=A0AAW1RQI9_9CHLO